MKFIFILLTSLFGLNVAKKIIVFETAEITYVNPKYGWATLSSNKYNASTFLINARINVTGDIPTDSVVSIEISKLSDNTYKKTALSMKKKLCPFLEGPEFKMMWSSYLEERFPFPKKCPFPRGFYQARDIDPSRLVVNEFFNFIPQWNIKLEITITSKTERIMHLKICVQIVDTY